MQPGVLVNAQKADTQRMAHSLVVSHLIAQAFPSFDDRFFKQIALLSPLAFFGLDTIDVIDVETGAVLERFKMTSVRNWPRAVVWNNKEVIVCGGDIAFTITSELNTCEAFTVDSGE